MQAQGNFSLTLNNTIHTFPSGRLLRFTEDHPVTLLWKIDGGELASTVTFGIQVQPIQQGWFGFAVSPDGSMLGKRAIVASRSSIAPNQKPVIGEWYLTQRSQAGVIPVPPLNVLTSNASTEFTPDGKITMLFSLPSSIGLQLLPDSITTFIYASGPPPSESGALTYHDRTGKARVELAKTSPPGSQVLLGDTEPSSTSRPVVLAIHGILMGVSFLILAPVGSTFALPQLRKRWVKWDKSTIPPHTLVHRLVQGTLTVAVIIASILGWAVLATPSNTSVHSGIGVVVFILLLIQVALGVLRSLASASAGSGRSGIPSATQTRLSLLKKPFGLTHRWTGRALYALGAANVFVGIATTNAGEGWMLTAAIVGAMGFVFYFTTWVLEKWSNDTLIAVSVPVSRATSMPTRGENTLCDTIQPGSSMEKP
ncbi:MAG: hypothetical protein DHS80DRAFT_31629 [Piptocephalis tieghemiana]|nr:MAG: hypothetical protein DHS80DRAFT_31629 [Piptocephalis tieghemiana]